MPQYSAEIRAADAAPTAKALEASSDREAVDVVLKSLPSGQLDAIDIWQGARIVYRCRTFQH
jgi:hypothetical protein